MKTDDMCFTACKPNSVLTNTANSVGVKGNRIEFARA